METEKLYSPLEFYLHDPSEEETGENGEPYAEQYKISHSHAGDYLRDIELTLRRECDDLNRTHGLAEYLDDELRAKVWSLFPSIEPHEGKLYFVAALELTALLSPEELSELKDWWTGQLSDGFGEGLEQREIKVGREELYIVPWSSGDNFFINTQAEFDWRLGRDIVLPPPDATADISILALKARLFERFDQNLTDSLNVYRAEISKSGITETELRGLAERIAAVCAVHEFLKSDYNFQRGDMEYLLRFRQPLQIIAGAWPGAVNSFVGISDVVQEVLADRNIHDDYTAQPAPEAERREPLIQARENGKTSVLDTLRRARENSPEHAPKSEHPGYGKSGLDL